MHLEIPELAITGEFVLMDVSAHDEPEPLVEESNSACQVTGRFWRSEAPVVSVPLVSGHELLVTPGHLLFSTTRGRWVPAAEAREGEMLRGIDGPIQLAAAPGPRGESSVWNLEVRSARSYHVGSDRVLAHNAGETCGKILSSRISESATLVREAIATGKSHQKSIDRLTSALSAGNLNPGTGTKSIGKGILEARARDGARVYFRTGADDTIEILGKSHKGNQASVIKEVLKVFGD